MKEMDSLENRLRSWQPRRPSAKLKRRLFAAPASIMPKVAWLIGSLAPATACVLLTLSVFNPENTGRLLRHEPMTAMILSNQNYAAYASDNFREEQNGLFSVTFDWTNHGNFKSSIAPFSRNTTN
jgi:hypothetical protein